MTVALATELAPDNINVNLVVPGKIDVRPPSPSREPLQLQSQQRCQPYRRAQPLPSMRGTNFRLRR